MKVYSEVTEGISGSNYSGLSWSMDPPGGFMSTVSECIIGIGIINN